MRKEKLKELKKILEEFKTLKKELIEPKGFIKVEGYKFLLNNGETIIREKILKNKIDGSAVIVYPVTIDGEVIVAIEPRVFTKETVDVGFPAGYIDKGESPVDAVKRELKEETGYEAGDITLLGSFYQDQGISSALNHYFLATNCIKVSKQKLDKDEYIKYMLLSKEEVDELIDNHLMNGLNSAYLNEKVKMKRRF